MKTPGNVSLFGTLPKHGPKWETKGQKVWSTEATAPTTLELEVEALRFRAEDAGAHTAPFGPSSEDSTSPPLREGDSC